MTDEYRRHNWDKVTMGAQCLDCGIKSSPWRPARDPCPGKTVEVQPRVWVGECVQFVHWGWVSPTRGWSLHAWAAPGVIFVPDDQSKPTIDPAEMETIRTCKEIDW